MGHDHDTCPVFVEQIYGVLHALRPCFLSEAPATSARSRCKRSSAQQRGEGAVSCMQRCLIPRRRPASRQDAGLLEPEAGHRLWHSHLTQVSLEPAAWQCSRTQNPFLLQGLPNIGDPRLLGGASSATSTRSGCCLRGVRPAFSMLQFAVLLHISSIWYYIAPSCSAYPLHKPHPVYSPLRRFLPFLPPRSLTLHARNPLEPELCSLETAHSSERGRCVLYLALGDVSRCTIYIYIHINT